MKLSDEMRNACYELDFDLLHSSVNETFNLALHPPNFELDSNELVRTHDRIVRILHEREADITRS